MSNATKSEVVDLNKKLTCFLNELDAYRNRDDIADRYPFLIEIINEIYNARHSHGIPFDVVRTEIEIIHEISI